MELKIKKTAKQKMTIGLVLLKEGIVDEQQLKQLFEIQKSKKMAVPIGNLAIDSRYLTKQGLHNILKKYSREMLIGELLMEMNFVSPKNLQFALKLVQPGKMRLGEVLVDKGLINEKDLIEVLSSHFDIPRVDPMLYAIDRNENIPKLSEKFMRRHHVLPAFVENGAMTLIMSDPMDFEAIASVKKVFPGQIQPVIATRQEIEKGINQYYANKGLKNQVLFSSELEFQHGDLYKDLVIADSDIDWEGDSIVNMVNYIITSAVTEGASDIHIEPQENKIQIRYRIDGILQHRTDLPKSVGAPLSSRIKVLCGLDIAERRKHQDGRIEAKVREEEVDLRVSTYVSVYGENIVIRILRRKSTYINLNQLGFAPRRMEDFIDLLNYPSGVILVTGPTGSGKTTTLYASLHSLKDKTLKIITVEDPVEYSLEGVVQGHLNTKIGLAFPEFIKSMMRQDPDVLMIGEIRDRESAEATIHAALTGHKVFSSFHTEDSVGALLRLMDMRLEPYLISSTLSAVLAQRLVRTICSYCRHVYKPSDRIIQLFNIKEFYPEEWKFTQGKGCQYCNWTGYQGRTGVHELLVMNDQIRDAILNRSPSNVIRKIARQSASLVSMKEDGFYKAIRNITTLEEVVRIVYSSEIDNLTQRSVEELIELCEIGQEKETTSA